MSRAWERIRRNPVPSLLKSLLEDHLDPGYAASAADRAAERSSTSPSASRAWLGAGVLLAGLVIGIAYAHNADVQAGTDSTRAEILDSLRAGDERITALTAQRDELGAAVDERRTALFSDGGDGATILDRLRDAEAAAAATPVRGPGITVTLTEPTARPNLSDAARIEDRPTALVLDRDLQSVVNALWAAGAEAVEVGGVRVGPGVTIRQAGGAMLVDNRPVFSPYTVSAVGSPSRLQTTFVVSDAYLRIAGIQQLYGVGFTLAEEDDLEFPAATVRKLGSSGETGYR
ncbi:DUF881 domain-containing protein [Rhodococcus pyridinivorans]|uniref:DUF881 domain-containing protein n=1 Tax=Rhodococcus TaxID=1827 RepID=UPI0007E975F5|nr:MULTISPECIES: DUF881 domain-containing protein [Rhodococcus]OBA34810.1 hypothetical protein A5767_13370 [Rhodococcus sp. 852002-51564_SCH6189132-a]UTM35410.1 DUF881 domain-containing protein [Rhodococcus pyridinivorans]